MPEDEAQSTSGLRLTARERRAIAVGLLVMAVLRFLFPGLPIDGTLMVLLGAAIVVWKFDIESIEIGGLKARALAKEFEASEARIKALPPVTTVAVPEAPVPDRPQTPQPAARITTRATDLEVPAEPVEQVLWAAEHARIELIVLAGNSGWLNDRATAWSAFRSPALARQLVDLDVIPPEIAEAIPSFMSIRNQVAHARSLPLAVVESAADVGLSIVQSLRAIPREWVRVVSSGVRIWADRTKTLTTSMGVHLVKLGPDGAPLHRAVYPCGDYYPVGAFVTWEWDMSRMADTEGWYEDPYSGSIQLAWSGSAFFAGRAYPETWGLVHRLPTPGAGLPDQGLPN